MTIFSKTAPSGEKAFLAFASCALKFLLAFSAMFLPFKSSSVSATDSASPGSDSGSALAGGSDSSSKSPPSCKDGYEYVEAVNKCYKACAEGWERNSETLRCRKIRVETSAEDTTSSSASESASKSASSSDTSASSGDTSTPATSSSSSSSKTSTSSAPPSCKDGYEYVESVGKCYKKCIEGYERNPETNRCRKATVESNYETGSSSSKSATSSSSSSSSKKSSAEKSTSCKDGYEYVESAGKCYKACSEGQIRNPETNRCKKAETSKETAAEKECEDGYERNPETNRCRKIKNNDGADYNIKVPDTGGGETTSFIAIGGIIVLVLAGAAFVIFQYRTEIKNFLKKHFKKSKVKEPKS